MDIADSRNRITFLHALSERRSDTMAARLAKESLPSDAASRVMVAVDTAVAVILEEPDVNRAVMSWIGTSGGVSGHARARSTALWTLALGDGEGFQESYRTQASESLPRQLALAFRGALSFWAAGELSDEALGPDARAMATTLLLGFAEPREAAR